MFYTARTQNGFLGFFLAMTITSISKQSISNGLLIFQLLSIVFILLAIFTQFKLKVDQGFLTYHILILTIPIYKKVVQPNQILEIMFKRVGWVKKGAIIQVKKGLNIRIINFDPEQVLKELMSFAIENSVPVSSTEGFKVLNK